MPFCWFCHDVADFMHFQCVEAILKVEYSGGPGREAGYCRCCSVALSIDVQPSLFFHKWDVLPSERSEIFLSSMFEI